MTQFINAYKKGILCLTKKLFCQLLFYNLKVADVYFFLQNVNEIRYFKTKPNGYKIIFTSKRLKASLEGLQTIFNSQDLIMHMAHLALKNKCWSIVHYVFYKICYSIKYEFLKIDSSNIQLHSVPKKYICGMYFFFKHNIPLSECI